MAAGRPSKYKPAYCKRAVDFLSQGYSVTALAGHLGVARSTVFQWAEENREFSDALKTGQAAAAEFWERALLNNAMTGEGNATSCIFGVKNRSRDEWRDKQETEISGPNGGPIETKWTIELVGDDES
jgi:transposase-like protein